MKTHSGEKPNKCNQCDFATLEVNNLRMHLRTHSGEKSNKCNMCDYASACPDKLRTHMKRHSGDKPNKCNQCEYAALQASNLRMHLTTHSQEMWKKQYVWLCILRENHLKTKQTNKCNQCKIFILSEKNHLWTHLKIIVYMIYLCNNRIFIANLTFVQLFPNKRFEP